MARSSGCPEAVATLASVGTDMEFLDALAAQDPAPGAGAAAALSVASAAALVAMAARSARRWEDADAVVDRAEALRRRATTLIDEDGQRYRQVLAREGDRARDPEGFAAAVTAANGPPAEVVTIAGEVTELALRAVAEGNPRLRGDATAAALLAQGAATAATHLVALNTAHGQLDDAVLRRCRDAVATIGVRVAALEVAP